MSGSTVVVDVGALHQHAERLAVTLPVLSDAGTEEDRAAIEAALDQAIAGIVVVVE